MKTTTYEDVANAIQEMGLEKSVILMHTSLKSFGHLEGGPDTLVRAFLDVGSTLVVPTFTYDCKVPAPIEKRIPQNGCVYPYEPEFVEAYDQDSTMISRDMGVIPARILKMEERIRGVHPMNSFTAIGPLANHLINKQSHLNVYGPLKEMYACSQSYIGLVGVNLTSATAIHLAEEKAGRRLFREWAMEKDGSHREIATGSCSNGFKVFEPILKGIEQSMIVGSSQWFIYSFKEFIDTVTNAIVENQAITHCSNANCIRCNDAVRGGPIL